MLLAMVEMRSKLGPNRKHEPVRTCLGCGEKRQQKELWRFVSDRKGHVVIDKKGRLPGRGAYCCPEEKCLAGFVKKSGRIAKALRCATVECGGILDLLKGFREGDQSDINLNV